MKASDEALVDICNSGNRHDAEQAFAVLYERHKGFVIRVALRYLKDHDAALDVLQETFAYLLKKFPPTGEGLVLTAKMTTLLYPVARNSSISLLRKSARLQGDTDPDELEAASEPAPGDIGGLLAGLTPERREVVTLRFVDGMTLEEIAIALQIPLGTVKSRLHLAIKALRETPDLREKFFS
jgi:RNA polymerase sigma-70 factor (ECF subfamily)